ncbi:hypothetical protein GCM10010916_28460 [Paenibacillus abyssi]|uniref:Uncharacterized protein n=1 Tax=Paenibacillus abyssi TaxID=1340531 RepID=A0A917D4H8_9BACL|nr:hypothetical protein GCM10010916_28460 [Paenibacillus abyssi]
MKTTVNRMAFYTEKLVQYTAMQPSKIRPRSSRYRFSRLMEYKSALVRQIEAERNQQTC